VIVASVAVAGSTAAGVAEPEPEVNDEVPDDVVPEVEAVLPDVEIDPELLSVMAARVGFGVTNCRVAS
jgi:hypothetical protein